MLPSITAQWKDSIRSLPRIYILEVRSKARSKAQPSDWLIVERVEHIGHHHKGVPTHAHIRISFKQLTSTGELMGQESGYFEGHYSQGFGDHGPDLSLTGGAVILPYPLRGKGIGTYFMNEIVIWAKQWPTAEVRSISLSSIDGDAENKDRRNRFYEQFGLKFTYSDPERRAGRSHLTTAATLTPVDTWKANISPITVEQFIGDCLTQTSDLRRALSIQSDQNKRLRERLDEAMKRPIRWATSQLWERVCGFVYPLAPLAMVVLGIWRGVSQR